MVNSTANHDPIVAFNSGLWVQVYLPKGPPSMAPRIAPAAASPPPF
eukprot:CAMPEP_0113584862 /NCGR_PEP_ID=MMETSP0015_2-20120614/33344_1 /TAXON_ID=2838 /ORGANISM="Odontella" /LENGTH=45 /DNA_ID=CAMNT_0000489969 /DNA_START=111 /DNA_END=245 /DNA_ORIENTATION=- /assembly_acc=CAM_ASM_000160